MNSSFDVVTGSVLGVTPPHVALVDYRRVGRSLQAEKDFAAGEVVLSDVPALEWSGDIVEWKIPGVDTAALLMPRREGGGEPLQVPMFLISAAAAFCNPALTATARQCILDMHVPELPIRSTLLDATLFCERLANVASSASNTIVLPHHVLHAMLAAKVNAHRGPEGTWRLYPWGSKYAHSCDPNCAYVPTNNEFVAIRDIAKGSLLTFSYLGGPPLAQPAELRQRRLQASHLFVCQCARCRGGDNARTLNCPSCAGGCITRVTSPLIDADGDRFPEQVWHCRLCHGSFNDTSATVTGSLQLEESLWAWCHDIGTPSHPYRLAELGSLLTTFVEGKLPRQHWLYGQCAMHLGHYFVTMGKATGDIPTLSMGVQWLTVACIKQASLVSMTIPPCSDEQKSLLCAEGLLSISTLLAIAEIERMLAMVSNMTHLAASSDAIATRTWIVGALMNFEWRGGVADRIVAVVKSMQRGLVGTRATQANRKANYLEELLNIIKAKVNACIPSNDASMIDIATDAILLERAVLARIDS